jgi:hypothetical protein
VGILPPDAPEYKERIRLAGEMSRHVSPFRVSINQLDGAPMFYITSIIRGREYPVSETLQWNEIENWVMTTIVRLCEYEEEEHGR